MVFWYVFLWVVLMMVWIWISKSVVICTCLL